MIQKPQILLTNDDGIQSPGLWTAASQLSKIGYVHVVAPTEQYSGAGRGMPNNSDGIIRTQIMHVNDQDWTVYSVGGSPAQAVQHAIMEILPQKPDLVVSGINYGENLGTGVTVSGTIGAAMEGAAFGIPSLAISLETEREYHLSYSEDIDFSTAGHFTNIFAELLLSCQFPPDVDMLKVDVPSDATKETPWELTFLTKLVYYYPIAPQRTNWEEPFTMDYSIATNPEQHEIGSDVHTLRVKRFLSVTPLSLDMTSRVDFHQLERCLRKKT